MYDVDKATILYFSRAKMLFTIVSLVQTNFLNICCGSYKKSSKEKQAVP